MQLLVNPFFEAHLADAFHVAGTRTVCQTIQRVQDGLIFGEFGDGKMALELAVCNYGVRRRVSGLVVLVGDGVRRGDRE